MVTQGIPVFPQRDTGYPEAKTGSNGWKLETVKSCFSQKDEFFPKVSLTQWNFAMTGTGTLLNQ